LDFTSLPHDILDSPWLVGIAAIVAGAVAAVSGFGIGSLLTPLLVLSMPTPFRQLR
jgi:uncharacterized membrane protein YfcA